MNRNALTPFFACCSLLLSGAACQRAAAPPAETPEEREPAMHAEEVHLDPAVAEQQGIRLARAEMRALVPILTVPARVTLSQEGLAKVASPVEGRIANLPVQAGAEVGAGDPLAVLDSPEFSAAQREFLLAARQEAAARAPEGLAREAWQRAADLHAASGDPPLVEVQRRESELKRAEAERIAAEGHTQLARERLVLLGLSETDLAALQTSNRPASRYVLRAPIAGRVIERAGAIGQFAGPDDPPLITIADLESLWVIANFPESRLRELRLGAKARVLLESEPDHGCPGEVVFISPVLDIATRTVEVRILPQDRHADLRPGLFARVEIEVATADGGPAETIAVPEAAVLRLDGASAVFVPVPGEPGTFAPRAVRAGRTVRGWIPILEGLTAGEEYVAEGGFLLKAELEKGEGGHDH